MKNKFSIIALTLATASLVLLAGCSSDVGEVKSGDMRSIPLTSNYAVGTDSTIVIVEMPSGKTLNIIDRHSTHHKNLKLTNK